MVMIRLHHTQPPHPVRRELITLREAEADPRYGTSPLKRSLEEMLNYGYVLLDKPRGPNSHEIAERVKRFLGAERAGHGGTLDLERGRSRGIRSATDSFGKQY
ncbi:MAG: hypothetical protein QXO86_03920 [Nitrososphaerota archaeon]